MNEPLYERLQRLKRTRRDDGEKSPTGRAGAGSPSTGWRESGGTTYTGRAELDGAETVESVELSSGDETDSSLSRLGFRPAGSGIRERRVYRRIGEQAGRIRQLCEPPGGHLIPGDRKPLLFFDAETTGLSAGAGTVAFLIGAARIVSDDTVEVVQLLLPDYPLEPEFLAHTAALLSGDSRLVSYNGKSFDTHVLRSRFLQSGCPWEEPLQLDLLYPTRRLWSSVIPDCRLSTVEAFVLGIERAIDLPGNEVPERYFAFLETGAGEVMREVIAHHEQDMVSLVLLLAAIEDVLAAASDDARATRLPPDSVGAARMLVQHDAEKAMGVLRRAVDASTPVGRRRAAMVMLAGLLKRRGEYSEAAEIWSALFREGRSELAGIELAKHLEHRERDFEAALAVCEGVVRLRGRSTPALDHRKSRLLRKAAGRASG